MPMQYARQYARASSKMLQVQQLIESARMSVEK